MNTELHEPAVETPSEDRHQALVRSRRGEVELSPSRGLRRVEETSQRSQPNRPEPHDFAACVGGQAQIIRTCDLLLSLGVDGTDKVIDARP